MKKPILSLLLIFLLSGCVLIQMNENDFENDPLYQDLLDGNNTFLDITPGEVELLDAIKKITSYSEGISSYTDFENNSNISGSYDFKYTDSYLHGILILLRFKY